MESKKTILSSKYRVELIVPDKTKNLNLQVNNINVYDENNLLLWNISELLKSYSDSRGLKYYEELYYDIRLLENNNVFCIGNCNHCEVDLNNGTIVRIVNNR